MLLLVELLFIQIVNLVYFCIFFMFLFLSLSNRTLNSILNQRRFLLVLKLNTTCSFISSLHRLSVFIFVLRFIKLLGVMDVTYCHSMVMRVRLQNDFLIDFCCDAFLKSEVDVAHLVVFLNDITHNFIWSNFNIT